MEHVQNLVFIFTYAFAAFVFALFFAPRLIAFLRRNKIGKNIRETTLDDKPSEIFRELHMKKSGTPTMGGILIWGTVAGLTFLSGVVAFVWSHLDPYIVYDRGETLLPAFTLLATGLLGGIDDWVNIKGASKGIRGTVKMGWLLIFASVGAWWFHWKLGYDSIHIPSVGDFTIGWLYVPLFIFIIVASANAVNITDGLDGLAAGLTIISYTALGVISYVHHYTALAAFCAMVVGATTAFLWFNIPPASFFMGDTGALALGATMGVIAMLTNTVLVLPLIAFVFVAETLSSFLQLFWKRFLKRKLFPIAPMHHWLEKLGWPEHQVTMRLWIVGAAMAGAGLVVGLIGMGTGTLP